jgi:hypothetical protein
MRGTEVPLNSDGVSHDWKNPDKRMMKLKMSETCREAYIYIYVIGHTKPYGSFCLPKYRVPLYE